MPMETVVLPDRPWGAATITRGQSIPVSSPNPGPLYPPAAAGTEDWVLQGVLVGSSHGPVGAKRRFVEDRHHVAAPRALDLDLHDQYRARSEKLSLIHISEPTRLGM